MKDSTKKWVEDSIKYFENMGFFQDGFDLERIHEELLGEYFDRIIEKGNWGELDWILLSQDTKRTAASGTEIINSHDTAQEYMNEINGWSAISNGVFTPTNFDFQWVTKFDIFTVSFDFNGSHIEYRSDETHRVSPFLLYKVNGLIRGTGFFFYECNAASMESQVILLTELEKDKLVKERNWYCYLAIE